MTNDGGPAFPIVKPGYADGMTLRDWFAGQALQGMAAQIVGLNVKAKEIAHTAYFLADAMLKERER